jgi:hypothetical protein
MGKRFYAGQVSALNEKLKEYDSKVIEIIEPNHEQESIVIRLKRKIKNLIK